VVFPADFNTAAAVMERVFQTHGQIWTIVIAKADAAPDLFTASEARSLVKAGGQRLDWAGYAADRAEITLVAVGGYQLGEVLVASRRLAERGVAHTVVYLLEPGPGFKIESMKPEGQKLERDFRAAIEKKTGSYPLGAHQLAASGLWILKMALDKAGTDELEKFRAAVLSIDLPVGSTLNGWGVKFNQEGQNANDRVQHYMLQWQNGQLVTVWPEEFSTIRAKWIPLGPWDQRK